MGQTEHGEGGAEGCSGAWPTKWDAEEKYMIQNGMVRGDGSDAGNRTVAIVACNDPEIQRLLMSVLGEFGLEPVFPKTLDEAEALLAKEDAAIVFSQPKFGEGSFREILRAVDGLRSRVPVIVCSKFYDGDLYIEAMALGAFDYLAFPCRRDEVAWVVYNVLNGNYPTRGPTSVQRD